MSFRNIFQIVFSVYYTFMEFIRTEFYIYTNYFKVKTNFKGEFIQGF
jgi:hypothetical protein